jgi:hypothetical protein
MPLVLKADLAREVASLYEAGASMASITAAYGVSKHVVRETARRHGVSRRPTGRKRTYALDEGVFDQLTPESAYWVGFFMADGCVYDYGAPMLALVLGNKDAEHLARFRAFLRAGNPLHVRDNGTTGLYVSSRRLAESLAKYGVLPRKSLVAKVVGLEWDRDFWRGVVDGDGSVKMTPSGASVLPSLALCGSEALVVQFTAYCRHIYPALGAGTALCPAGKIWRIRTAGYGAQAIIAALYQGAALALPRKALHAERAASWQGKRSALLPPPVLSAVELRALRSQADSWRTVARLLGVSPGRLFLARKNAGIVRRSPGENRP